MCLLLNLRGVGNTLNYPKDTQLNTTYSRHELAILLFALIQEKALLSLVIFLPNRFRCQTSKSSVFTDAHPEVDEPVNSNLAITINLLKDRHPP